MAHASAMMVPAESRLALIVMFLGMAVLALALTAINMFGGFAVTRRMLAMFRK